MFCGFDRASDHHDVAVVDGDGKLLERARIADDTTGLKAACTAADSPAEASVQLFEQHPDAEVITVAHPAQRRAVREIASVAMRSASQRPTRRTTVGPVGGASSRRSPGLPGPRRAPGQAVASAAVGKGFWRLRQSRQVRQRKTGQAIAAATPPMAKPVTNR